MEYIGGELELFARASNWKSYLAAQIGPFVHGRVLEAGAGIGSNIPMLFNARVTDWLALEPDGQLAAQIERSLPDLPKAVRVMTGTTTDLPAAAVFDTILYIDVLEHIQADSQEVARAARHLAPGGHLIILSPAHQFLFSPFDAAISHVQRYNSRTLCALTPASCSVASLRMLDCAGFVLSLGNRLLMRAAMPTPAQIALWDKVFVPASRLLDPVFRFRLGKSIMMVWQKQTPTT